jgi:hypothetical protein
VAKQKKLPIEPATNTLFAGTAIVANANAELLWASVQHSQLGQAQRFSSTAVATPSCCAVKTAACLMSILSSQSSWRQ